MEKVVVSLGGSLIVPDKISVDWLKEFRNIIEGMLGKYKFIIICGGGKTAREYQNAARELVDLDNEDLDWLGIHATRLNAHLLRTIFKEKAHSRVVKDPTEEIEFEENLLIAGGWKPGWSTDYVAVKLAENLGVKRVINLSNIDYIYDKDPKKNKDAKLIREISWKEFRKIVGDKWDPGMNAPFDPVASKLAEKSGIEVAIMGRDLENLKSYLEGRGFEGSVIK